MRCIFESRNMISLLKIMCKRISEKKGKEWIAIDKVIPAIEDMLKLTGIKCQKKYESESPDFVFYNAEKSIGVEVVECHPSCKKSKDNAPVLVDFQKKVCKEFLHNEYLMSLTEKSGLNIIIYQGASFNAGKKIKDVCDAIECCLKVWDGQNMPNNFDLIAGIRVIKTKGKNIVQFNNTSGVNRVSFGELYKSINDKQRKFAEYAKKRCDEYWLCVYLPFEEKRHAYEIDYNSKEDESKEYLKNVGFHRICVTSAMHNDLNWLKGRPS